MKFIKKREEPREFSVWKQKENENWKPTWSDLRDDSMRPEQNPKTALRSTLLHEQGYICCYCGRRIDHDSSHIEHLKPRQTYPELSLDYFNLLASCPGYSENTKEDFTIPRPTHEHCGHKKQNWYDTDLMVSPLDEDCETYFTYTAFGEILARKDDDVELAAQETIKRLGLNYPQLETARRRIVEEILDVTAGLTPEEIEILIESYAQPDKEGKYVRFCGMVLYFLRSIK